MTITEQTLIQMLATYITTELNPAMNSIELQPDTPLIESGIIDSLGLFKLISFIEERFDVMIEPDEIVLANFETLDTIHNLIMMKRH